MASNRKELENRLKQAVYEQTPDVLPQILSARKTERGKVIDMTKNFENKKKHTVRNWAIGAAAALVLAVGAYTGYQYQFAVDTAVSIDVNPSIQLEVNRSEKVLSANALNEDAEVLLEGMELKGTNLKTAVNAVIGSMVQNGYLTDDTNSILLTVDNSDPAKQQALQKELTEGINASLKELSVSGSVFSQSLTATEELEAIAAKYGISQGKAYWIQKLCKADSTLSPDVLAALSINDLALLGEARDLSDDDYIGIADDSAYIGTEKASQIAVEKAGGGEVVKIEMDLDDGVMVYEGDLVKDNVKYEFDIDATTGKILKWETDMDDDDVTPPSTSDKVIGEDKAKEIVLKKIPGATITEFKLDEDDGRLVYEGEAYLNQTEYDFEINAVDGTVLKWESETKNKPAATPKPTTKPASSISLDDAKNIVLKKVPGATITEIKLDYDDGRKVYEGSAYKGSTEYDFEINASTGDIIKWESERMDDDDNEYPVSSNIVTEAKAREAVLNKLPGATILSIELDEDDGVYVYEGDAKKDGVEYEFVVDAKTGKVLECHKD